jgi:hypothetical protein
MKIRMAGAALAALAMICATGAAANQPAQGPPPALPRSLDFQNMAEWLSGLYTEAEFRALAPNQVTLQSQQCSCYDEPTPHFPYLVVVLATPRGDLILRPDQRELHVSFVKLALRQGDLYCGVEPGSECFGRFADVCDFTDHRYGAALAPYFPTCRSPEE